MSLKVCIFITGLVYLFFGIAGLFPEHIDPPPPQTYFYEISMIGHWGYLFGWLPTNLVHNIVYIAIGAAGILASPLRLTAMSYARTMFFVTTAFTILGFLPFGIAQLGGLIPLFDWNIMLHCVTAILLYYWGFVYPLDLGGKEPASEILRANA